MTISVLSSTGNDELARVFVAQTDDGSLIEFVESIQPPLPRENKWVLIVSTLKGCPIGCPICDAGGQYRGKLTALEIMAQIEHLVHRRFPDGHVPASMVKIQFARMGDPAFNDAVLEVLRQLPKRFDIPGLMPSVSTVAPLGTDKFMYKLAEIKRELYPSGRFQMQFSLHTSDEVARRTLVPARTWSFQQMSRYGEHYFEEGDRKISLNFAPAKGVPLEPSVIADIFCKDQFMIKLTPINPTFASRKNGLVGAVDPADPNHCQNLVEQFTDRGFETILSIGDLRENQIGSNCGMYAAQTAKGDGPRPMREPNRNRSSPVQRGPSRLGLSPRK